MGFNILILKGEISASANCMEILELTHVHIGPNASVSTGHKI
jgi:hypothetical protein